MKTTHKIYLGDCLDILPKIKDESIDLIFADPPYGLAKKKGLGWKYSKHVTLEEKWDIFNKDEFFQFNKKWISECLRVLKHGGSFWVSGSFHNIYQLGFILKYINGLKINNSIVWFKPNAQPNITCRFFTESTEHLIWATKNGNGKKWTFNYQTTKDNIFDILNPKGKQSRNVWVIPLTTKKEKWAGEHPTQKPIELLRRIIISSTKSGDIVLDPFTGSGTTNIVAQMYGRNSIGIEKEKKYFDIIRKRFNPTQKKLYEKSKVEFIEN